MKKIITIITLAAGTMFLNAQGTIEIYNIGSANGNYIDTGLNAGAGGTSSLTPLGANGFYYTLLTAAYGGAAPSANPLDASWSQATVGGSAVMATNYLTAGSIRGPGANNGFAVDGWAAGATEYFMLVGWSSNLGDNWSTIASQLLNGWDTTTGYFGASQVAYLASGGVGVPASPATSIFGGTGLPSGITLYAIPVPEPATMALAGLGGLSLLLFRRRKN